MKNKKKILYIVEAMGGGIFTYIVDLSNKLCEYFDIYIAYSTRPQTPLNYKSYFDKRIQLIEVSNFTRPINLNKDLNAYFEIKKITKRINPDIIHLHSSKAGVLGRIAFNGKRVPLFYTPHGYSFLMKNQNCLKRSIYKLIEKVSTFSNCVTISCSKGEHNESLKLTSKSLCINNGINIDELDKFIYNKSNLMEYKDKQFTVYTIGRICYQKNPEMFNEIAHNMPNIRFIWIGDGELRHKLTSKNIEITGWLTREEALKKSLKGDVFLLTSLWEGLPLVLLESMYMKKPCIVSNTIGNKDVITNGINGYVCNNLDEYLEAIKKCKSKKQIDIINNAYDDIMNIYNTDIMCSKYKEIYINSINKKVLNQDRR